MIDDSFKCDRCGLCFCSDFGPLELRGVRMCLGCYEKGEPFEKRASLSAWADNEECVDSFDVNGVF